MTRNQNGGGDRYTVISADGHASALVKDYREYFDPKYRADFDAEVEATEPMRVAWREDPAGAFCVGNQQKWDTFVMAVL